MVSHTFPGIAPVVISTRTFDSFLQKIADGKAYQTGIQTVSPAVGGQFVGIRVTNPVGSGVNLYIVRVRARDTNPGRFEIGKPISPLEAALTTVLSVDPKLTGQAAAKGIATQQNNLVGQVVTFPEQQIGLQANQSTETLLGIVLTPNSTLDLQYSDTTAASVMSHTIEWYEE